jgi:hypothetical protein
MILSTIHLILQNRNWFDLVMHFEVFDFHKPKISKLSFFPDKHQNLKCAKSFIKLLGYDNSTNLGNLLFDLCGEYDVMPMEFEIYFSELFDQFSLLCFLPLETLYLFLLHGTPLFYMSLLFLQLFHHILEFSDPFFISSDLYLEFGKLFCRYRLIQIYGNLRFSQFNLLSRSQS